MSFQKHLMMRLAVDKLGATDEETPSTKPIDRTTAQLTAEVQAPAPIPFSQRMGAALRLWVKTILPF